VEEVRKYRWGWPRRGSFHLVPTDARIDPSLLAAFRATVREQLTEQLDQERRRAETLRSRMVPIVRLALVEARRAGLCDHAWLFGSYAWGTPTERSDIDLLVAACREPEALASVVGRATGTDVHVVPLEQAPRTLVERVETEGLSL
jgi:predicted nucleotidyltransferase